MEGGLCIQAGKDGDTVYSNSQGLLSHTSQKLLPYHANTALTSCPVPNRNVFNKMVLITLISSKAYLFNVFCVLLTKLWDTLVSKVKTLSMNWTINRFQWKHFFSLFFGFPGIIPGWKIHKYLNCSPSVFLLSRVMQRKQSLGKPDQKDLNENLAATQGLAHMIAECKKLFQVRNWEGWLLY